MGTINHGPNYCAFAIVHNGNQWSVRGWERIADARHAATGDPKKKSHVHMGTEFAVVNSIESAWAIMPENACPVLGTFTLELWETP